jgi:ribonuclease I
MKSLLLLLLLVNVYTFNLRQAKQEYDSYVMAVQWSNGYCSATSCGTKADHVYENKMTIHGLWPSLKSGKYLSQCTTGVEIVDDGTALFTDMKQYWPSFSNSNEYFWEHEYNKHGFCMVEEKGWDGYKDYFSFVIDLHKEIYNDLITNAFPDYKDETITVTYNEMKTAIKNVIPNAIFKMNCKSGYVSEFYFYLEKDVYTPSADSRFSNSCSSAKLVFKTKN